MCRKRGTAASPRTGAPEILPASCDRRHVLLAASDDHAVRQARAQVHGKEPRGRQLLLCLPADLLGAPRQRRPRARTLPAPHARSSASGRRQWCAPRACETHRTGLRSRAGRTRAGRAASGVAAAATAVRSQRGAGPRGRSRVVGGWAGRLGAAETGSACRRARCADGGRAAVPRERALSAARQCGPAAAVAGPASCVVGAHVLLRVCCGCAVHRNASPAPRRVAEKRRRTFRHGRWTRPSAALRSSARAR